MRDFCSWGLAPSLAILALTLTAACSKDDGVQIPNNAYCSSVDNWGAEATLWEARLLELINQARAVGANCASDYYGPTHPLKVDGALLCAARVHSQDMHDRGFFDHTNPDGDGPSQRAAAAGWTGGGNGENIVGGYGSADAQFDGWMDSPGHCRGIMNPNYNWVGPGYFGGSSGFGDYATLVFGR